MTNDDENLTCPITQQLFRDPVLAEDGHLYERAAITRWINEHGTSPFTRQMLDANHLQLDDEVRKKAELQREYDQLQRPPIHTSHNIHSITNGLATKIRSRPELPRPNVLLQNEGIRRRLRCTQYSLRQQLYLASSICVLIVVLVMILLKNLVIDALEATQETASRENNTNT